MSRQLTGAWTDQDTVRLFCHRPPDRLVLITGPQGAAALAEALTALREERPATLFIALDDCS